MARPASNQLPRFASDGSAAVTEPNSGKKDLGWVVGEKMAAQYLNWLFNRIWQFLAWLFASAAVKDEEQVFTFAQLFAPATGNKTAVTAVGHGTGVGIECGGSTAGSNGINASGTRQSGGSPSAAGVGVQAGGNDYRAALNLVPQAAPLGALHQNGDIYVSTDDNTIKARINGAWKSVVQAPKVQSNGAFREDVHLVGSGGEPAFGTNFHNYGPESVGPTDTYPVGFWKDSEGVVHLEGRAESTGAASAVFTLPVGYRPAGLIRLVVWIDVAPDSIGFLLIWPNGDVAFPVAGANGRVELTGVSFRAA